MIPFLAVAITIMVGFTGLAVDTGMIWVTRANLQNSVDAAALAAAQELPASDLTTTNEARSVACEYSTQRNAVAGMFGKTGSCGGEADVTFPEADGTSIEVTAYRAVQPTFGRVLGFAPVEVFAQSRAKIGSLGETCVFPLFLTEVQVNRDSIEFFVPVKFNEANTAIDVESGSQAVREAMGNLNCEGNSPTSSEGGIGSEVDIKSGSATQFRDGWLAIENKATSADSVCPDPDISRYTTQVDGQTELIPSITLESCPRLIIVPVLPAGSYGGNATGVIEGFVPFYFSGVCTDNNGCTVPGLDEPVSQHKAWGYFVQLELSSTTYADYQPEFGTKVVVLEG
jgi:hypothetical protein